MRFTVRAGAWYGLTMFPGYGDHPYHSPIRVDGIEPVGNGMFDLVFLNLGYASGVQLFKKRLQTLRRAVSHLVAAETQVEGRTYVLVQCNAAWLNRHFPDFDVATIFDDRGDVHEEALLRLAG